MLPLAQPESIFGSQETQHRVGGQHGVIGPDQEFRPITYGQHYDLVDSFCPGQLHQGFAAPVLADPEAFPNCNWGGAEVQANDHQGGFQSSLPKILRYYKGTPTAKGDR